VNHSASASSKPTSGDHTERAAAAGDLIVPGTTRDIRVKIAEGFGELEQAFELVSTNPRARGCGALGDVPSRFTPFRAPWGTVTIVAKHQERVVATLSLVADGPSLGLPLERIYGAEVEQLRRQGRRMAETISLADSGLSAQEFVLVLKAMIKLAVQYHAGRGGDTWVIAIDRHYRNFYQKVLGFAPMGSPRSRASVQGHAAEVYMLDTELMRDRAAKMYAEVFPAGVPRPVPTARF
jgi:hypothetical protein